MQKKFFIILIIPLMLFGSEEENNFYSGQKRLYSVAESSTADDQKASEHLGVRVFPQGQFCFSKKMNLTLKELGALWAEAEKSIEQEKSNSADVRKRRLELADLFKTMPHLMKKLTDSSEPGEQLVVVQGDMKYYSFLKVFLTHINQVFSFHGGPQKLLSMAKNGNIKKNAGLSVVIDQQGKVLSKRITHTSGHSPADTLILEAIELASPFPPVPKHFNHKTVRVELVSVVHL